MASEDEFNFSFDDPEIWKEKGNEYFTKGDYDSALKCYRQAIEIDPNCVSGWNNYGLTLLKLGGIDEATAAKKKADELRKTSTAKEPINKKEGKEWCLNCGAELPYTQEQWPPGFPKLCHKCGAKVQESQGETHEEQLYKSKFPQKPVLIIVFIFSLYWIWASGLSDTSYILYAILGIVALYWLYYGGNKRENMSNILLIFQ
jgi:tetratricopeptide (TPR) repeat protein